METYTLPLALLDFVPTLAFLAGAYFLIRLTQREKPGLTPLMTTGTLMVFSGGFLKATWKLLFTLGVADIRLLAEQQFVLNGIGFLLMLIAMILLARGVRQQAGLPLMAMALWKIPFLALMVISNLGALGILSYLAFRRRIPFSGGLFVVAIVCMLGMAGLSGGEQTIAKPWVQETINTVGQLCFGTGTFLLYKRTHKQD